jgi:hypothetical protein
LLNEYFIQLFLIVNGFLLIGYDKYLAKKIKEEDFRENTLDLYSLVEQLVQD